MLRLVMETGFEMTIPVSTRRDVKGMINENYPSFVFKLKALG